MHPSITLACLSLLFLASRLDNDLAYEVEVDGKNIGKRSK